MTRRSLSRVTRFPVLLAALVLGCFLVGAPAAQAAVSATVSGGVLTITGDAGNDSIVVTCIGGQVKVNGTDPSPAAACSSITTISIDTGAGDDTVSLVSLALANFSSLTSTTFDLGPGRDQATGGQEPDLMIGGPDDDIFTPGQGNDVVQGGGSLEGDYITETIQSTATLTDTSLTTSLTGTDTLNSVESAGLSGGGLADVINAAGFSGETTLSGLGGIDTITGGSGGDEIFGGTQGDSLDGGPAEDRFTYEPGNDTIVGGNGNDYFEAPGIAANATLTNASFTIGGETDTLSSIGHAGLYGDNGGRTIDASGFSGQLLLFSGTGNDTLMGGSADDFIGANVGTNTINGGPGMDRIEGSATGASVVLGASSLVSTSTNTTFSGIERAQSYVYTNAGQTYDARDFLGTMYISGGSGNDTILGGVGKSQIHGDEGDDILKGFGGPDRITGDEGNDTLVGGKQNDHCTGGPGADTTKSCEVANP